MDKVAIFGAAGAVGRTVGAELARRGIPLRVVGRSERKLREAFGAAPGVEIFCGDLGELRTAAAAARGVDTVIYSVGVDYSRFDLHPKLMRVAIDGAAAVGVARLVVVSSVYSYGVPVTRRVAETHPREPAAYKGRMRKEQEDLALRAPMRAMVVRLPDFYGPFADNSLANPIFRAAIGGGTANWLGPVAAPHEFVFMPDAGPVIADLAARDDCYGEAWNCGGAGEITGIDFITRIYRAAGRSPKYRSAGKFLVKFLGWFNPVMKELPEMLYLQETPVILDDSKLIGKLGTVRKTPYDEGIARTIEWMKAGR